jgi:hypothetical protein
MDLGFGKHVLDSKTNPERLYIQSKFDICV